MTEEEPRLSAEELLRRLDPSLSPARRLRAVVALVAGLAGAVFVAALWAGEPAAPPGATALAFGLLAAFCLAWAAYGGWLLTRRVPLFATDRVVAGWIGLVASVSTTAVLTVVAAQRGTGLWPALSGVFVVVALVVTVRAHARRAALLRRARELGGGDAK